MTLQLWERRTEPVLTSAALVFFAAWAVPILWVLPRTVDRACECVTWLTWGCFAADYLARCFLARGNRREFVLHHIPDLLVIALPLLRPLRLLRLVPLLRFANRRAVRGLRGKVITYVIGGAGLLWVCGSLAVLDAERHEPGQPNIMTIGDAGWWAITTMTTVGYGDHYPVTLGGKLVAVMLMLGGIGLLGTVTATLASWLVDLVREETAEADDAVAAQLARMSEQLDAVQGELAALRAQVDTHPSGMVHERSAMEAEVKETSLGGPSGWAIADSNC